MTEEVKLLRGGLEKLKSLHMFASSLFHYETGDWRPYEKEPNDLRLLLKEVEIAIAESDTLKNGPSVKDRERLLLSEETWEHERISVHESIQDIMNEDLNVGWLISKLKQTWGMK